MIGNITRFTSLDKYEYNGEFHARMGYPGGGYGWYEVTDTGFVCVQTREHSNELEEAFQSDLKEMQQ